MSHKPVAILLALAALMLSVGVATGRGPAAPFVAPGLDALSPAFTYQGRLTDGGGPANGQYDFKFDLYDAATTGTYLGTVLRDNLVVASGLFTTGLDFDSTAFNGQALWLEIRVRPGSASGGDPYTLLSPRQALTAAPYALSLRPGATITGAAASALTATSTLENGVGLSGYATGSGSDSIGVFGFSSSTGGTGVAGWANAGSGTTYGVSGRSDSPSGQGVRGLATATTGSATGVFGQSVSANGYGIYGLATAVTGVTTGVYGAADSTSGIGVFGGAGAPTGVTYGVYAAASSTSGRGVYGHAASTSGLNYGVFGRSDSPAGVGVTAQGSGTNGTALEILDGAIRVGSSTGAATPVFVHTVVTGPGGNICGVGGITAIDNPYANGDPNAILIVTVREGTSPVRVAYDYGACGLVGARWLILVLDNIAFNGGESFNVMVIKQ